MNKGKNLFKNNFFKYITLLGSVYVISTPATAEGILSITAGTAEPGNNDVSIGSPAASAIGMDSVTPNALNAETKVFREGVDPASLAEMYPRKKLDDGMGIANLEYSKQRIREEIFLKNIAEQYPISAGPTLKPGQSGKRVKELEDAMVALQYLDKSEATGKYDEALKTAVARYQANNSLVADGVAGEKTFEALAGRNKTKQLDLLKWSLDNAPFISPNYRGKHVIVNIATQTLRAYDSGKLVLTSRVIVGKPKTQTPVLRDTIDSVTVNPTWNIPPGIAKRSFGGKALAVKAGPDNPLGKLRIDMGNPELIYLHHTNTPQLFARSSRLFSSGCVRVEKAYDLAVWLADSRWESYKGDETLRGSNMKRIPLKEKVYVNLVYNPVEVLENGNVLISADPYDTVPVNYQLSAKESANINNISLATINTSKPINHVDNFNLQRDEGKVINTLENIDPTFSP